MNDVEKMLYEKKKDPDERNEFLIPLPIVRMIFLASLCKKGERLAAVSITIVSLVITSVSVNATKVSVRGKKPRNANHVFFITRKAVVNAIGSR